MAKRAPAEESVYNPLDENLAQSVIQGTGSSQVASSPAGEGIDRGDTQNRFHASRPAQNRAIVQIPGRDKTMQPQTGTRSFAREKRVLLTAEEEREVERLVDRMGEQLGASLKLSHMLRASLAVLCHAEQELLRRAAESEPLVRPSNGDAVALAQFEQALARLLSLALRDAPPVR
jgi:hypothetical protein